jgi:23S rRNA pseudouridine955/2504/2580 synthase/23S rRNA pseudouridine1911/1915/1917 synthase
MKISDLTIYEDDDLIAINKPAGLLSIPDREGKEVSLKKMLQEQFGQIFTIHRLDKETSGLIIFAKNETSHKFFSKQFEERQTIKIYQGLVIGSPAMKTASLDGSIMEHPGKKGTMVINHKGKESLTEYEVLEDFSIYAWLQFRIYTGRTHQIRVHMKDAGHPVVCDTLYGDGKPLFISSLKHRYKLSRDQEQEQPILNRLALHSLTLGLIAMNGQPLEFSAPLPKDLRASLQQLEKRKK